MDSRLLLDEFDEEDEEDVFKNLEDLAEYDEALDDKESGGDESSSLVLVKPTESFASKSKWR